MMKKPLFEKFIDIIHELEDGTGYGTASITCHVKGKGQIRFVLDKQESSLETDAISVLIDSNSSKKQARGRKND